MNLYAILGVRRNASVRAIKAAYRERSKTAHPDGGGSVEAFQALNTAWRVLSDPEARRRYDETGDHDQRSTIDSANAAMLNKLAMVLDRVLRERGDDVFMHGDAVAAMKTVLSKERSEILAQIDGARKLKAFYSKVLGRLKRKDGEPSVFDDIVSGKLGEIERALKNLRAAEAVLNDSMAMVDGHKFEKDSVMPYMLQLDRTSAGASTTFMWRNA